MGYMCTSPKSTNISTFLCILIVFILVMIHVYVSRVTREVDEVVGMKQEISYDDLGKMGYLSQVRLSNAWKEKGDKVSVAKIVKFRFNLLKSVKKSFF